MPLFPGLLTRNWQLKISALAMAVLLWTVPRFEAQRRQVLESVPVRVQVNDPDWALRGEPFPETVRVTLTGPARALFALVGDRPSLVVPVEEVAAPDTAVLLRPIWLRIPELPGVEVESLEPSSVRLSFEPMEVAALPLVARLQGRLPEGVSRAGPPSLSPAWVRVLGPTSRLAELDTVFLFPLDLATLDGPGPHSAVVDTTRMRGMSVSPTQASVLIPQEGTAERAFFEVPVQLPHLEEDPQFQVRPATVTVTLVGARSLLGTVAPSAVRVFVPPTRTGALPPGAEERVLVAVEGIPDLVEARLDPQLVLLRRPAGL